jgi:hypothetical protein
MKFFDPLKTSINNMINRCKNGTYKLLENTDKNIKLEYNTKTRNAVINVRCADDDMSDMGLEVIHIECRKAEDKDFVDIPFVLAIHDKSVKDLAVFQKFLNVIEHFEEMVKEKQHFKAS